MITVIRPCSATRCVSGTDGNRRVIDDGDQTLIATACTASGADGDQMVIDDPQITVVSVKGLPTNFWSDNGNRW